MFADKKRFHSVKGLLGTNFNVFDVGQAFTLVKNIDCGHSCFLGEAFGARDVIAGHQPSTSLIERGDKPGRPSGEFFYGLRGPLGTAEQTKKCGQRGQVTASTSTGNQPAAICPKMASLISRR